VNFLIEKNGSKKTTQPVARCEYTTLANFTKGLSNATKYYFGNRCCFIFDSFVVFGVEDSLGVGCGRDKIFGWTDNDFCPENWQ